MPFADTGTSDNAIPPGMFNGVGQILAENLSFSRVSISIDVCQVCMLVADGATR